MANEPTCVWAGVSGATYTYWVYPRHPSIKAGSLGNYVYARINEKNEWVPIYFGQGDLSVRSTQSHHQITCIDSKGATHVHMHTKVTETDRLAEEKDLLANYLQAYAPTGCNQKTGG